MILLIGGEKGGTGKTTVATNLAQIHACAGHDTLLLDMDKQESATAWIERRSEYDVASPACVTKHSKSKKSDSGSMVRYLLKELKQLSEKYETIIIDSGGRDSIEFRAALSIADKLYTPVRASQSDLDTLEHLNDEIIEGVLMNNPDLECSVFINCASTNIRSARTTEAKKILGGDYYSNLKLSNAVISDRDAFVHASSEGLGVCEMKDEKARTEIMKLYKEIFNGA